MQRDTRLSYRVYGFAGKFWCRHSRVSGEKYPISTLLTKSFFLLFSHYLEFYLSQCLFGLKFTRLLLINYRVANLPVSLGLFQA